MMLHLSFCFTMAFRHNILRELMRNDVVQGSFMSGYAPKIFSNLYFLPCLSHSKTLFSTLLPFIFLQDLTSAVEAKQSFEREIKILQERLAIGQRAWDSTKKELSRLKKNFCETEESLKNSMEETKTSQNRFCLFMEQIADLLSRNSVMVKPSKEDVLDRIQEMSKQEENRKQVSVVSTQYSLLSFNKASLIWTSWGGIGERMSKDQP